MFVGVEVVMNAIVDTRMRLFGYFPLSTKLIQTHIVFKYKQLSNRIIFNNRIMRGPDHRGSYHSLWSKEKLGAPPSRVS